MIIKDIQSTEPDTIWSAVVNVEDADWATGTPVIFDVDGTDAGNPLTGIRAGIDGVSGRAPDTTGVGELYHKLGVANAAIAQGATGLVTKYGFHAGARVEGTVAIAIGDPLKTANATTYFVKGAVAAVADLINLWGVAFEAYAVAAVTTDKIFVYSMNY
jgi:hypothetical protein